MRRAVIVGVVVVALLVLVDFTAAAYAEYRLSRWLRTGTTLQTDPNVYFHGFPFLWQARTGEFDSIEFRASERSQTRTATFLSARLYDVKLSWRELFRGPATRIPVSHVEASARIDETELGRILDVPDLQITEPAESLTGAAPEEPDQPTTTRLAVLSGTVPLASGPVRASVLVEISVERGRLSLHALSTNPTQGIVLDPVPPADPEIIGRFTRTLDKVLLPFHAVPTEIQVSGTQVVIQGSINNQLIKLDQLMTDE